MELIFDSGRLIYNTNELRKQIMDILEHKGMYVNSVTKEIIRRNGLGDKPSHSTLTYHELYSLSRQVSVQLSELTAMGLLTREKHGRCYLYRKV